MKIKNKLIITNLTVFLLFLMTISLFFLSTFRLIGMMDLEREAKQVRNRILQVEYASRAVLNSPDIPLYALRWAGEESAKTLDAFRQHDKIRYLDEETYEMIQEIYSFQKSRNFNEYYTQVSDLVLTIRPKVYGHSLEKVLQDSHMGKRQDPQLYKTILEVKITIHRFIDWYKAFAEQFLMITDNIVETINSQIRTVIIQTTVALIFSVFLSIVLILITSRNMLIKIRSVRTGIELISGGNLSTRISVTSSDELATMGKNFNILTETISQKLNTIGSIIHDMGQSLTQNPDSSQLEKSILNLAMENTHAHTGAYYRTDPETRTLVQVHRHGNFANPFPDREIRGNIPFGKTIIGMTALSGDPVFLKEPGGQNLLPQREPGDYNFISSCIVLPLISERLVFGVICLEKNRVLEHFTEMDFSNILSFIEFSAVTLKNLERYTELLHSTGLNREMQIASDIQKSLLPPRIPRVPRFDISVKTYSVKGISGDIYDFFPVGGGRWLFCMAEVLEKGIASSMQLVILRTLVRILVRQDQDPAVLMNLLLKNFRETTGLTTDLKINLCLMEPRERTYYYCGTKDQNLLILDRETGNLRLQQSHVEMDDGFRSVTGTLNDRDCLILMTDGFYNAVNETGEQYGWNPVMRILKKYSDKSSEWLQDAIVKDLRYFERGVEQVDDRTMFIAGFREQD